LRLKKRTIIGFGRSLRPGNGWAISIISKQVGTCEIAFLVAAP
jgi:hypothetical protein